VSVSGQPLNAAFDATTGSFEWLPSESDIGLHPIRFTATSATGEIASKTVLVEIESGRPTARSLQNAASASALAVCSPGSVATALGRFLSGNEQPVSEPADTSDEAGHARILVNGSSVPITSTAKDRLDFVCPTVAPGTSLEVVVETKSGLSNRLETKMQEVAPGIFTADGSGAGQALAWRTGSSDLVLVPSFRFQGKPALAGDKISVLVTGINCVENSVREKPLLNLSNLYVPIDSLVESTRKAGACEVGITVPEGRYGDAVPLTLDVIRSDGRIVTSNIASIAIDNDR